MKKKFDKCKNEPWKECCNDCKELECCCYICKDIVKVKVYIKHLGEHYDDVVCAWLINVFLSLGFELEDVNIVSIFKDIDTHIRKTDSRNMSNDLL